MKSLTDRKSIPANSAKYRHHWKWTQRFKIKGEKQVCQVNHSKCNKPLCVLTLYILFIILIYRTHAMSWCVLLSKYEMMYIGMWDFLHIRQPEWKVPLHINITHKLSSSWWLTIKFCRPDPHNDDWHWQAGGLQERRAKMILDPQNCKKWCVTLIEWRWATG